jgi:hypothetical protein
MMNPLSLSDFPEVRGRAPHGAPVAIVVVVVATTEG